MERVERLNSFKNWWEGLQKNLSLTIFYAILLFFVKALHLGISFSLVFITYLDIALLVESSLTTAMLYISSASVMLECRQSVKIDQSEGIPDPGIPEQPFVKFAHRRSLASSWLHFFYFFSRCAMTN